MIGMRKQERSFGRKERSPTHTQVIPLQQYTDVKTFVQVYAGGFQF